MDAEKQAFRTRLPPIFTVGNMTKVKEREKEKEKEEENEGSSDQGKKKAEEKGEKAALTW